MKKILIYGDSNVWGDNFISGRRINDDEQWPNILEKLLNKDFKVIQEGLPGRLAGDEAEKKYKNGKYNFLSTFRTCAPVDIVIIALGTNDLQIKYDKDVNKIIDDLLWYEKVIESEFSDVDNQKKYFVNSKMPEILYLLPPKFDYQKAAKEIFDINSEEKRKIILNSFSENNVNRVLIMDEIPLFSDGIHFNQEGHKKVALLVERKILNYEY